MSKYSLGPDIDLDQEVVLDEDGTRITEKRAQEITTDVIHHVRGRGRPSLSGAQRRSPQVTFRVSEEVKSRAENEARRRGINVSELARQALERELT